MIIKLLAIFLAWLCQHLCTIATLLDDKAQEVRTSFHAYLNKRIAKANNGVAYSYPQQNKRVREAHQQYQKQRSLAEHQGEQERAALRKEVAHLNEVTKLI